MRFLLAVPGVAIPCTASANSAQDPNLRAPTAKFAAQPARSTDAKVQMEQMGQQMQGMRMLQGRMVRAATPDERQRLMQEQHKAIQDGMRAISQMMDAMNGSDALTRSAIAYDPNGPIRMMRIGIDMMALVAQVTDQLRLITSARSPALAPVK